MCVIEVITNSSKEEVPDLISRTQYRKELSALYKGFENY
jgi:hypothetical protein